MSPGIKKICKTFQLPFYLNYNRFHSLNLDFESSQAFLNFNFTLQNIKDNIIMNWNSKTSREINSNETIQNDFSNFFFITQLILSLRNFHINIPFLFKKKLAERKLAQFYISFFRWKKICSKIGCITIFSFFV